MIKLISSFLEDNIDFRGLRLDWYRFQAYVSIAHSSFSLFEDRRLAITMNTTVFHLKMVDLLEEMLRETCDLSIYWFAILKIHNSLFFSSFLVY